MFSKYFYYIIFIGLIVGCADSNTQKDTTKIEESTTDQVKIDMQKLVDKYVPVKLTADISHLSDNQKEMLIIFIEVAKIMDDIFWEQAWGNKDKLLKGIDDDLTRRFAEINYGPWDRLNGNKSFVKGIGEKPLGANYYPLDMTKDEFEQSNLGNKKSLYTYIKRDPTGLVSKYFYEKHALSVGIASTLLMEAAKRAEDAGLKKYLEMRAEALRNDDYRASDMAWLDMKTNDLDFVVGPIENYEDQLFGYKAAFEAYVLIKDKKWSKKLEKYAAFLPELQEGLPVPQKYKNEKPGNDVELNAYDVVYYAGDCNAGSKTIAINLPNDEVVQLEKGTRRLQLKNAMKIKFEKILLPIADVLIDPEQRKKINFDAFFANTMFHEVAHGLGIKNTINGKGTCREALKELYSALEEGKADLLGLYMIKQLHKKGEIEGDLENYYITFVASIFRSIRFGASSAHGKANMIRFNYFKEAGAIEFNKDKGHYKINFDKFDGVMDDLSELILTIQGDGDYEKCKALVADKGIIKPNLQAQLDRLSEMGIPVDVTFIQGTKVLGLN